MNIRTLWEEYVIPRATQEALAGAKFRIDGEWHVPHSDNQVRRLSDGAIVDLCEPGVVVTEIRTPVTEVAHVGATAAQRV